MRQPRTIGPDMAIVAEAVRELKSRFEYPDDLGRPSAAPGVIGGGGGGGEMTVTVAASDATDFEKERADYQCTGAGDDQEILAADARISGNGRIKLSSGNFYVTPNTLDLVNEDTWIQGTGPLSTVIRPDSMVNDSFLMRLAGANDAKVSDLTLFGGGGGSGQRGIEIDGAGDVWLRDIWAQSLNRTFYIESNRVRIHGLRSFTTTYDIYVENNGYREITLTESWLAGYVYLANAVSVHIVNNLLSSSIYATDARGFLIADNSFIGNGVFNRSLIELGQDNTGDTNEPGCIVADNYLADASGWNFIDCEDIDGLTVIGNRSAVGGTVYLQSCVSPTVIGNVIEEGVGDDGGGGETAAFEFRSITDGVVTGNQARNFYAGGFYIDDSSHLVLTGNLAYAATDIADNTYDCYQISGASDRNLLEANKARSPAGGTTARYGFNVGGTGECNMVVGNDFGDPDDYGTDALVDTASNTQLFYPNDATYGDNFTDCGSGS